MLSSMVLNVGELQYNCLFSKVLQRFLFERKFHFRPTCALLTE